MKRGGNGGKRPGAGRPKGSTEAVPRAEVRAIKACGLRLPENAKPEAAVAAEAAWERIADVMLERVHFTSAGHVLKAAIHIREEVCGPVTQRHEHAVKVEPVSDSDLAGEIEQEQAHATEAVPAAAATHLDGGTADGGRGAGRAEQPGPADAGNAQEGALGPRP